MRSSYVYGCRMFEQETIFVALAGSHAHGTAHDGSDVDIRGVCVAPLSLRLSLFESFEQHEGPVGDPLWTHLLRKLRMHPSASRGLAVKTECVVYDVAKFLRLCANSNPNALEILFTDERDWLLETPTWRRIHDARRMFLSRQAQESYLRYALAQLRQLESRRARAPEGNAVRNERDRKFGFDTKHAMHLVRLMRTGIELLRDGDVQVRRKDADELSGIRDGTLTFDQVLALSKSLQEEMTQIGNPANLPDAVDQVKVDQLAFKIIRATRND